MDTVGEELQHLHWQRSVKPSVHGTMAAPCRDKKAVSHQAEATGGERRLIGGNKANKVSQAFKGRPAWIEDAPDLASIFDWHDKKNSSTNFYSTC